MKDEMMIKCRDSDDTIIKEDVVESTKSEMAVVREENMRLKTLLEKIEKDYKALQKQVHDVFGQSSGESESRINIENPANDQEKELVSLRLGTSRSAEPKTDRDIRGDNDFSKVGRGGNDDLKLGLDYYNLGTLMEIGGGVQNPGLDDCTFTGKTEEKGLKTQRNGDEEFHSQTEVKKARVCVRARCDTATMNDGCQWRKYGQKLSKGNPCPRAYYRCTVSPSCPVRKQVQRCLDDMSILVTTYEGTHNHPLPLAATAMASTTSSAASMLQTGSSTSQIPPDFHPWNKSCQAWLPYYLSTSPSASSPTVTVDLTTNVSSSPNNTFGLCPSAPAGMTFGRSVNFSSMDSNKGLIGWGSGGFSHGVFPYNYNTGSHSCLPEKSGHGHKYQASLENALNQASSQKVLTETLTEVITFDPGFRSVIAAALSSMVANGGPGKANSENLGKDLTMGDHIPAMD